MGGSDQNSNPTTSAASAAPAAPAGYSAADIQKLYTDKKKLSDVPRALKGLTPGADGLYTLAQLQGLTPSWMSGRSKNDWAAALSGLKPITPSGTATGAAANSSPSNMITSNDLTVPFASLANNPGFQQMGQNAGYTDAITPMPNMNPTGWNRPQNPGIQTPTASTPMPQPSPWNLNPPNAGQMTNWISQNWNSGQQPQAYGNDTRVLGNPLGQALTKGGGSGGGMRM